MLIDVIQMNVYLLWAGTHKLQQIISLLYYSGAIRTGGTDHIQMELDKTIELLQQTQLFANEMISRNQMTYDMAVAGEEKHKVMQKLNVHEK